MILQNSVEENKIFIDDNLKDYIDANYNDDPNTKIIELNSSHIYEVKFSEENISLVYVSEIYFDMKENKLTFYNDETICIAQKYIDEDEIISLSLGEKENQFNIIELTTMKLPKFLFENDYDEKFPKFEIKLSDCVYSMRIYLNVSEYIDIPDFQSHSDIHNSLDHISKVVYYLDEWRPKFIEHLCNDNNMALLITNKDNKKINCGIINYKLGEKGLYLSGGELENYLVEWQKFFKLVMDNTWEVSFEDE